MRPAVPAAAAGGRGHDHRVPDRAGPARRQGRRHEPALSAVKFAHQPRNLPDPTRHAQVVAVWEGIHRTHGARPEQAAPLMPPELLDVLDACRTTKTWRGPRPAGRTPTGPASGTGPCCWSGSSPPCAAANWPP
jgi:hypothetical protein